MNLSNPSPSHQYIKNQIDLLVETFPSINCRYEYDELAECHYIEVSPRDVYRFEKRYHKEEIRIKLDFLKKFPGENVYFLPEGELDNADNIVYERPGYLYALTKEAEKHKYLADIDKQENYYSGLYHFPEELNQKVKEHDIVTCVDPRCSLHSKGGRPKPTVDLEKLIGKSAGLSHGVRTKSTKVEESNFALSA